METNSSPSLTPKSGNERRFRLLQLFEGRLSRAKYTDLIVYAAITITVLWALLMWMGIRHHLSEETIDTLAIPFAITAVIIGIPLKIIHVSVTVRRLHDFGRSGFWYLVIFIPFAGGVLGLVLLLFCFLKKGDVRANAYGEVPRKDLSFTDAILGWK